MSMAKRQIEAEESVERIMFDKGFISYCDCGRCLGLKNRDESLIYAVVTTELKKEYKDLSWFDYRGTIKHLIDTTSLITKCDECGYMF